MDSTHLMRDLDRLGNKEEDTVEDNKLEDSRVDNKVGSTMTDSKTVDSKVDSKVDKYSRQDYNIVVGNIFSDGNIF